MHVLFEYHPIIPANVKIARGNHQIVWKNYLFEFRKKFRKKNSEKREFRKNFFAKNVDMHECMTFVVMLSPNFSIV